MGDIKVMLFDMEGTITPISFVKNFLFPYSKKYCREYLENTWTTESTQILIHELISIQSHFQEFRHENNISDSTLTIDTAFKYVCYLIDRDLRYEHLKQLQANIWESGYENGTITSNVYEDVPQVLERLLLNGIRISTFSILYRKSQQLLMKYCNYGDLSSYVKIFFDNAVGHKFNKTAYECIAKCLKVKPHNIAYLTDAPREALAAQNSGMTAMLINRSGNDPLTDEDKSNFKVINDFNDILDSLN